MSENLPAVRTGPAPLARDTDSWTTVMGDIARLAEHIAGTEFVPRGLRGNVPATAAAVLYGREIGLPPMASLTQIHVIEGRPALSAEGMRALILAAGHELVVTETTGALCTIRGRRRYSEHWTTVTWTLDMARAAGILGKPVWKSYPRQMLQARATTELARLIFADVIRGLASIEELEDMAGANGTSPAAAPSTRVRRGRKAPGLGPAPAEDDGPPLDDSSEPAPDAGSEESLIPGEVDSTPPSPGPPAGGPTEDAQPPVASEAGPPVEPDPGPRRATRPQHRLIMLALDKQFGVPGDDREERLYLCGRVLRRELASFNDLTLDEASHLIETFGRVKDRAALNALLDTIDQADDDAAEAERQDLAGEPAPELIYEPDPEEDQ